MAPELVQPGAKSAVFAKPVTLPKRAYVTFLAGNGDYVKGVVGLAKGLRKVKSAYQLVVSVLPDVPEEHRRILENHGCIVREIEPVYPPENQTQFALAYYVINYSKLRIWEVRSLLQLHVVNFLVQVDTWRPLMYDLYFILRNLCMISELLGVIFCCFTRLTFNDLGGYICYRGVIVI